jgi:riboflavin kinase/FMN adenylyltransferase
MKTSVIAIGNFDGVHRGHQTVLRQARALADEGAHACLVLTFDPHPREVLGGGTRPPLMRLARRIELLREAGADEVVVEPFTVELAAWSPERFARELLAGRLGARAVVVGSDFRFGRRREGDLVMLGELGRGLGFAAVAAQIAGDERGPFSSTRARSAIEQGDLEEATRVLGRPHAISGRVEEGDRLGRTLGFPTANLGGVVEQLPPYGVYAVRVGGADERGDRGGVMNIGMRPTVDGSRLRIEAHVFDFDGDLYGRDLRVDLVARLRGEQRFESLEALKAQIAADAAAARAILARGL